MLKGLERGCSFKTYPRATDSMTIQLHNPRAVDSDVQTHMVIHMQKLIICIKKL